MEFLFFIIGAGIFVFGVYLIYDHINYERIAMETTGKVIGFEVSRGSKNNDIYKPVVESYFGEFTSGYGSSIPTYEIGERVDVLYISGKEPRLKSNMPYYMGITLMLFGGIFCLIFFSVFSFTAYNFLSSLFFLCIIAVFVRRKLKTNGIDSLDEWKEKFVLKQEQTKDFEKHIIRDRDDLEKIHVRQQKMIKFVGPVFAIIGLGVIGLGIYLGFERYDFLETAVSASGTVIDFHESRSDDGYTYYPIVEYAPAGSYEAVTFRHDTGSNPPSFQKGEAVKVLHLPDTPHVAIIDKGIFNWTTSIFVTCFGLLFAVAGLAVTVTSVKRNKRSKFS